ncbi:alanine--tRNA ligase [candidate division KSB1 bacterium]|nr:alanine--tRNA ligase [candidate division KSB1 bacterium]
MTSSETRQSFLDFFKSKQHQIVSSAPVVPQSDPTLLFTNAGMNQFKDIFLGTLKPSFPRVANSQKCIRVSGKHNDLEEVGKDTYHHTFFEMLGNWSFGDYFKKEAIEWAWELLTEVWKLPKDRLYATVFSGDEEDNIDADEEAAGIWKCSTDIDPAKILYFGKKDNFWEMGTTGPCGPCSEIHIDLGPEYENSSDASQSGVNSGSARYIEIWNLVFIQYNRDTKGVLHPLPAKHVDTGAGFERLVAVLQKKGSNYETDLFKPIIEYLAGLTGQDPYKDNDKTIAFQVLADHIRALSFAITDGAIPGNEGRGYVLRRILRRGARFGRVLNMTDPFIYKLVNPLVEIMGDAYPEIRQRRDYIMTVIRSEEESFNRTLDRGIEIFEEKVAGLLERGTTFSGSDAFLLHDTYGFPLDLTQLMAEEKGLKVDVEAFNREMQAQRKRSSQSRSADYDHLDLDSKDIPASEFVGYQEDEKQATVVFYRENQLILNVTPFYAKAGGQIGDSGMIYNDKLKFKVTNTKHIGEHIVHVGELIGGDPPKAGDRVTAIIDKAKRRATERNHTVTHLLHKALNRVLGDHVNQAGSLVHPDYMRFDFTHFEKVSGEDLGRIENIVNEKILENLSVNWQFTKLEKARQAGAVALFGEKYGEDVRVVEVERFSKELCGGTHVRATGEIGNFVIINETAVAAGVRRIEALTGLKAHDFMKSRNDLLQKASAVAGCSPEELDRRVQTLVEQRKELENDLQRLRQQETRGQIEQILDNVKEVKGVKVLSARVDTASIDELKSTGDYVRDKLQSGIGVLGAEIDGKVNIVCIVSKDLIEQKGLKAGDIIREVATIAGGGGGGSPHMATAGARDAKKLDLALSKVFEIVDKRIKA